MELKEKLPIFVERLDSLKETINTEEATKTAMIMPFFQMLGYDIFNPIEFVPEYTADVGMKKGEKVDYAIVIDKKPLIFIECKSFKDDLDKFSSQLFRYFGTSLDAKFGILTNGSEYRFYTDLENENRMDEKPFLIINLLDLKDRDILELEKFTKDVIDVDSIINSAENLKYINLLKDWFSKEMQAPSVEFVKLAIGEVYDGIKSQKVIDKFNPILKKALQQYINDTLNNKIKAALNKENEISKDEPEEPKHEIKIDTTIEELEALGIVKAILRQTVDSQRISYRDTESYFGILLDDNGRKWICRIHLNSAHKHITISDSNKNIIRYDIETLDDIYSLSNLIIESCRRYL